MSRSQEERLRVKVEYIRELIKEKDYDQARALLTTIDHPSAKEWLRKLDQIAPLEKPLSQRRRRRISPLVSLTLITLGCLAVFSFAILNDPRAGSYNPFEVRPTADISAQMLQIEPSDVEIRDPFNTGLPERFLDNARTKIANYGYVNRYSAEINDDRRLIADMEVELDTSRNIRSFALTAIEILLRLYASETTGETGGAFTILITWQRGRFTCYDNAGMGYQIIQTIDWQSASQSEIFRAIDRNIFSDNLDQQDYGRMAWSPDPSGISDCNA